MLKFKTDDRVCHRFFSNVTGTIINQCPPSPYAVQTYYNIEWDDSSIHASNLNPISGESIEWLNPTDEQLEQMKYERKMSKIKETINDMENLLSKLNKQVVDL